MNVKVVLVLVVVVMVVVVVVVVVKRVATTANYNTEVVVRVKFLIALELLYEALQDIGTI